MIIQILLKELDMSADLGPIRFQLLILHNYISCSLGVGGEGSPGQNEGESGREERIKENYAMVSRLSQQQEEQKENSYHGGHVVQTFPL